MARHDPIDVQFQVVAEKQFHPEVTSISFDGVAHWVLALAMFAVAGFCLHTLLATPPL